MEDDLTPSHLFNIGFSFFASRTFLTAVELNMFDLLNEPKTSEEIRVALDLHPRGFPDFPDALVGMRVIERDGDGPDSKYSNTPESAAFLVRSSPRYCGGMLAMCAHRLYAFWGHFTEALRTGEIQNEANKRNADKKTSSYWDEIYSSPEKLEMFMEAMKGNNTAAHRELAKKMDFSNVSTVLDVGGATAQLCIEVAKANENMTCFSMDLNNVTEVAKKNVKKHNLEHQVKPIARDMMAKDVPFPKADVIVMGMILHDYGMKEKFVLLRKAYAALNEGGRFVAVEMLIYNERRNGLSGLLMSLNMMIETESGFDYSAMQFDGWAKEVGFVRSERLDLHEPIHAVIAYK